eukprot:7447359-Alexandrium_andersonii.AAC.1
MFGVARVQVQAAQLHALTSAARSVFFRAPSIDWKCKEQHRFPRKVRCAVPERAPNLAPEAFEGHAPRRFLAQAPSLPARRFGDRAGGVAR